MHSWPSNTVCTSQFRQRSRFLEGERGIEAQLDLGHDVLQRLHLGAMRDLEAMVDGRSVVVAPLVDAHLLAGDVDARRRALLDVLADQHLVDGDRGVMAVRGRPDDVLRPEGRVAAEEHLRLRALQGRLVELGQAPLVELDAGVRLDPGEGVLLADRDQHVVARMELVGLARRDQRAAALGVVLRPSPSRTARPVIWPSSCFTSFGTSMLRMGMSSPIASSFSQGDAFISSKPERTITLTSSPPRRRAVRQQSIAVLPPPSTITRLPTLVMWPNETEDEPVEADMDVGGGFLAARHVEIAAARRAGADEHRVVAFGQHLPSSN